MRFPILKQALSVRLTVSRQKIQEKTFSQKMEELESKVNAVVCEVQAFTPSEKNECIKIQGNQMFEDQIKTVGSIVTRSLIREIDSTNFVLWTDKYDYGL